MYDCCIPFPFEYLAMVPICGHRILIEYYVVVFIY
jgi:hypothetical protein